MGGWGGMRARESTSEKSTQMDALILCAYVAGLVFRVRFQCIFTSLILMCYSFIHHCLHCLSTSHIWG